MSKQADAEKALTAKGQIVLQLSGDYNEQGFSEWNAAVLDQLRGLSGEVSLYGTSGSCPMSVRTCLSEEAASAGIAWQGDPSVTGHFEADPDKVAILEADVPYDTEETEISEPPVSEEQKRRSAQHSLHAHLEKRGGDLLLAMNIAVPGAQCAEMQFVIDGSVRSWKAPGQTSLDEACAEAKLSGWPPVSELPLSQCLHWLDGIPGFDTGVPTGPAGHAVAALSHLGESFSSNSPIGLMWCMVGLEALYNSGREGLAAQFREKIWVLLGKDQARKKAFSRLYDYRSRFVHGSMDFPIAETPLGYPDRQRMEDMLRLMQEAACESRLASALLVATLQSMVHDGITELPFRWVLGEE